jgi:signal transduction histidine kinase
MSLDIFILVFSSAANLILGSVVLLRNFQNKANQCFFLISFFITSWTVTNYLTDNTHGLETNLLFARLANLTGFQIVFWIMLFSYLYPRINREIKLRPMFVYTTLALGVILPFLKLTIEDVHGNTGVAQQDLGPLYYLFILVLLVVFGKALAIFTYRHKHATDRNEALRLRFLVFGFLTSFVFAIVANIILPVITGDWQISRFGPIFSTVMVGALSVSIIKHQLFDIRRVIARALAYTLLVITMTAAYAGMVFGLANHLTSPDSLLAKQVVPITTAIFLAFSVPYLKLIFDKLTNSIFFRDAYDPQAFLDQLNKTLVSNIELRILLRRTALVIQENMKCETCYISIGQTTTTPFRVVGAELVDFPLSDLEFVCTEEIPRLGKKIIDVDELSSHHTKLKRILSSHNIVLVNTPSGVEAGHPALVHLMIGPKKSGNVYNEADTKLIEIITDELVIAVQNALRFEEIQNFNTTLQARINEATNKLQRSNNKLQVLDQTKDEFISMASHQLRTPLTSIKGYLSMVLEGDAGKINEDQEKMLQQAFISAQRMTYLISDLLNVSRLKTGKFVLESTQTNLAKVVKQEVEQLKDTARVRNLKLVYDEPKDFPIISIDETKIRQVIMNFLDNAIYYTRDGGTITVELHDKPKSTELTITDNGMGVPKNMQPHLFTKFYRAPNAKKARPDGTGLGLFMAKKVIVAQGGAIIFKSQEGKGSTFGFSFPKKPPTTD